MLIRKSSEADSAAILTIISPAAEAYRGVITPDRSCKPYMVPDELEEAVADGCRRLGSGSRSSCATGPSATLTSERKQRQAS